MVMNKTTRQTHRWWCVSNGSQTLQRGQLRRLCLPDAVLLGHWDVHFSFTTTRSGGRKWREKTNKERKKNKTNVKL